MKHLMRLAVVFGLALTGITVDGGQPATEIAANPPAMKPYLHGPPRPPVGPITVDAVWGWRPTSATFEVSDSDHDGKRTTAAVALQQPNGKSRAWPYDRLGQRIEFMQPGEGGSVMLDAIDNIEKGVIVRFTPALCVMPPRLQPGQAQSTRAEMVVVDRHDPSHQKASGTAQMTVLYDADQTVRTPAGAFACRRIRVTCEAEFGWGTTRSVSTYYYAPDIGLVAECYDSHTTLLLIPRRRQIVALLTQRPAAATPTAAAGPR